MKDYKSEQNPLKMLKGLKECFFGKVGGPQSSTLSKTPLQIFFNWFIYLLRVTAYQRKLLKKEYEFWHAMYIMLPKMYCSWFLAVTACTFDWPMIDLLRNKDESLKWTASTFKCDQ